MPTYWSSSRRPKKLRFKKPYKLLTYQPMVELVHYLQDNGFQVYITSGGGCVFMRAVCEEIYGIPRAMTIGSSVTFTYAEDAQGVAQVMRTEEIEQPIDDGPGKPQHIHRAIGRRPIMAAGNSDGDIHMLKYARGHTGSTSCCWFITTMPSASTPTTAARKRHCN